MTTLTNTLENQLLIYNDTDYNSAVNYRHLYNAPVTLNYEDTKYMLPVGTSDHLTVLQDGIFIYVIGQNNGLSYISLTIINTELKEIEAEVFLNESDCTTEENYSFGILELETEEQVKILCEYTN